MTDDEFRSVYERHRDPLFRFAWRLTGSPQVSEDIVHDCFVSLFRGGFDSSRASMQTYLFAAARNLTRKHHRDSGREFDPPPADARDALDELVSGETSEQVRRAVEALPVLQREVLVLFEYEEVPLEEIASIVEADIAAVKSRLYRARESLRKSLLSAKGVTG
jgi:RNA polymerase sigma-70 factor, ECF subfamily